MSGRTWPGSKSRARSRSSASYRSTPRARSCGVPSARPSPPRKRLKKRPRDPRMWIFPLLAALISLVFAAVLIRASIRPARPAQARWAIALLMYAAASLAMFLGSLSNWTPGEFRLYWLLGATLTVPYLAQGEIYLLAARPVANVLFVVLIFGTAYAVAKIGSAPIQLAYLHEE